LNNEKNTNKISPVEFFSCPLADTKGGGTMNAIEIAAILDAKKSGPGWLAKCPTHDDRRPSLWFSDQVNQKNPEGKLRFECKAGCSWQDIRAAIGLSARSWNYAPQTIRKLAAPEMDDFAEMLERGKARKRKEKLQRTWDESTPILPGSIAWNYLVNFRKVLRVDEPVPAVMRETILKYFDDDGKLIDEFPAIVSRMAKPDGNLACIHRTYLAKDGMSKAPVEKAKKLMSPENDGDNSGAAIRLFEPEVIGDKLVLGIAEGIETALAAHQLFGTSVWAAWSSGGIAKFVPPPGLTHLFIFHDNDSAGRKAASELEKRIHVDQPKIKTLCRPPEHSNDWADVLVRRLEAI
jgi:putative DNA primase/helicase